MNWGIIYLVGIRRGNRRAERAKVWIGIEKRKYGAFNYSLCTCTIAPLRFIEAVTALDSPIMEDDKCIIRSVGHVAAAGAMFVFVETASCYFWKVFKKHFYLFVFAFKPLKRYSES